MDCRSDERYVLSGNEPFGSDPAGTRLPTPAVTVPCGLVRSEAFLIVCKLDFFPGPTLISCLVYVSQGSSTCCSCSFRPSPILPPLRTEPHLRYVLDSRRSERASQSFACASTLDHLFTHRAAAIVPPRSVEPNVRAAAPGPVVPGPDERRER